MLVDVVVVAEVLLVELDVVLDANINLFISPFKAIKQSDVRFRRRLTGCTGCCRYIELIRNNLIE